MLLSCFSCVSCEKMIDVGLAPVALAAASLDFPLQILGNAKGCLAHELCQNNKMEVNAKLTAVVCVPGQVNSLDSDGKTPLHVALENGMPLSTIKILIKAGADLKVLDKGGQSPLCTAFKNDSEIEVVKLLFLTGLNCHDFDIETHGIPLLKEAVAFKSFKIFDSLLKEQGFPKLSSGVNRSLIMLASKSGSTFCVTYLVDAGMDVNCEVSDELTPLALALENKHYATAAKLIDAGANCNHFSCLKYKLLPLSVRLDSDELFKALVDRGDSNFDSQDEQGLTALHIAVELERENNLEMLIDHGANTNVSDKDGNRPIHIASLKGNQEFVRKLVRFGADLNVKNVNGDTPLHLAIKSENLSLVVLLVESKANLSLMNTDEVTIMQAAAQVGNDQIINYLLTQKS